MLSHSALTIMGYLFFSLLTSGCLANNYSFSITHAQHPQSVKLTQREAKEFLLEHNRVRKWHALDNLYWSPKLALYAQHWANELKRKGCQMTHRPQYGSFKQRYGENLYWSSPIRWSDGYTEAQALKPQRIVRDWSDEVHDYNYFTNQCYTGKICGHYTQIVWRSTQFMGCATAQCPDHSQIWVCNYDPAGNYIGQQPY